jgi:thioredoxin 1
MASNNVHELNELNFESLVLCIGVVLVDFTAAWCPPCRALSPLVARIADETAGRVFVGYVDADACPDLASRYGVRALPTVIVFQGGRPIARRTGLTNENGLRALLLDSGPASHSNVSTTSSTIGQSARLFERDAAERHYLGGSVRR